MAQSAITRAAKAGFEMYHNMFAPIPPISKQDRLRTWWHQVLQKYGRLHCYGIILVLPSDREAIRYLKDFGEELHHLSGEDCLVIALTNIDFRDFGAENDRFAVAIDDFAHGGQSVRIADLMGVHYDQFPCLLVFSDIRTPNYVLVSLRDLDAEQITQGMRSIFSVIHNAISHTQDPVQALKSHQNNEELLHKGRGLVVSVGKLADRTLEAVISTWVKTTLNK